MTDHSRGAPGCESSRSTPLPETGDPAPAPQTQPAFAKDTPTAGDKKYLAAHYLELLYGNNPGARDKQLERAIRLMTPVNGRKFFNYLKDNRILEQQAVESWQAVWMPQTVSIYANDHFTVRAIGIQRLTRIVNGA